MNGRNKESREVEEEVLRMAIQGYIANFILMLGALGNRSAIQRRTQVEKDIDQTKRET